MRAGEHFIPSSTRQLAARCAEASRDWINFSRRTIGRVGQRRIPEGESRSLEAFSSETWEVPLRSA